jgi:hypothetical protein
LVATIPPKNPIGTLAQIESGRTDQSAEKWRKSDVASLTPLKGNPEGISECEIKTFFLIQNGKGCD